VAPSALAFSLSQPPLISGRKRRKQDPSSHLQADTLQKLDYDADVDEINDAIGEGINDFDCEGTIPEEFIPPTESSHAERRRRSANAWQQVMPTFIHPLMAALHNIAPNITIRAERSFSCVSGCQIRSSTVKSVSFGGVHVLFYTPSSITDTA
jgi:hypothetical protein